MGMGFMLRFLVILLVALAASSVGFKKYVWFISIGYGFAIALLGVVLLVMFQAQLDAGTTLVCALLVIYGIRLGGYLTYRELRTSSYGKRMKGEIKDGSDMTLGAKCGIWAGASILYACEVSPVLFRLSDGLGTNAAVVIGALVMVVGLVVESTADLQKQRAKRANPRQFVRTGLFGFVRCPNYLGELLFWTGVFVTGFGALQGLVQWLVALVGYLGIIFVMFSVARRLEIRQNKTYGNDPEYRRYVSTVPIMIPFVHLYSVEKYRWLVA